MTGDGPSGPGTGRGEAGDLRPLRTGMPGTRRQPAFRPAAARGPRPSAAPGTAGLLILGTVFTSIHWRLVS